MVNRRMQSGRSFRVNSTASGVKTVNIILLHPWKACLPVFRSHGIYSHHHTTDIIEVVPIFLIDASLVLVFPLICLDPVFGFRRSSIPAQLLVKKHENPSIVTIASSDGAQKVK